MAKAKENAPTHRKVWVLSDNKYNRRATGDAIMKGLIAALREAVGTDLEGPFCVELRDANGDFLALCAPRIDSNGSLTPNVIRSAPTGSTFPASLNHGKRVLEIFMTFTVIDRTQRTLEVPVNIQVPTQWGLY